MPDRDLLIKLPLPVASYRAVFRVCGIYIIVNGRTGKVYVGSSKEIGYRVSKHLQRLRVRRHTNPRLQNSFSRHGEDVFYLSVLEECREEDLLICEQKWMDATRCTLQGYGYNVMPRADRKFFSAETRLKLSLAHVGHRHTEEAKRKIAAAGTGRKSPGRVLSDETKRKLSVAFKGNKNPMWNRTGRLNPLYGRKRSPETIAKVQAKLTPLRKSIGAKNKRPVLQICKSSGNVIARFDSLIDASKATGISWNSIGSVARCAAYKRGPNKSAGGFLWRFEDAYLKACNKGQAGQVQSTA